MLALSQDSKGEYAADTIVISIPRQVGKTYLIACIIFALCMMKPGLLVIWTAQVKDTALQTFEQFYEMSQKPKVKPHIARILQGKGDESIFFTNGSRIEFGARDSGFGRGRTDVDVMVFDEAQHLSTEALENMGAAQNVADNPLTFAMGTPPRPKDKGEFFTILRQEALDGDSDGTLYIEMSADRGADPMDREQWRKANPSFPARTTERAMLRLRKKLRNEDSWRREALGVWDELVHRSPFPNWPNCTTKQPPAGDVPPDGIGVDMSHDRVISITGCWVDPDDSDSAYVELLSVDHLGDTALAEDWIAQRAGRRIPVWIDSASPAASMVPTLKRRKVDVRMSTAGDMGRACGAAHDAIKARRLLHTSPTVDPKQTALTVAVQGCQKRDIGQAGAWGLDRTSPDINISPAVSMALAYMATRSRKKKSTGRVVTSS